MMLAVLAVLGPLLAAVFILSLRRFSIVLALLGASVSVVAATITLARVAGGARFATTLPGLPEFPLLFAVDPMSSLLLTVVAVVNGLVIIYAVGYMSGEPDQPRFFSAMGLFAGGMQALVLAGDWILFLVAWEIIGFASYLLIGFWFDRPGIGNAATRAFLVTRSADLGLYACIVFLIIGTGTSRIADTVEVQGAIAVTAAIGFLIAAMGKSAQIPLQGWLQSAMVGPTPVSALLHSATLVVAGVVLLTRAFPLFTPETQLLVGAVGATTMIVAGLIALAQRDIKRMLAASTSSQLGLMFLALAAGSPFAALFHLATNATMKSAMFLGAGIFQHARHSTEFADLRGVGRRHRLVFLAVAVAALALAGIPPLSGFWSKEAVIAATFIGDGAWIWGSLALIGSLITAMYLSRALRLLWYDGDDSESVPGMSWMALGLGSLALLSLVVGFAGYWLSRFLEQEMPESFLALVLGLVVAVIGLVAGWVRPAEFWLRSLVQRAAIGFRLGSGLDGLVAQPVLGLAHACNRLDQRIEWVVHLVGRIAVNLEPRMGAERVIHGIVERVGAESMRTARWTGITDDQGINGLISQLAQETRRLAGRARQLQTGLIHRELLVAAGSALVVLVVLLVR